MQLSRCYISNEMSKLIVKLTTELCLNRVAIRPVYTGLSDLNLVFSQDSKKYIIIYVLSIMLTCADSSKNFFVFEIFIIFNWSLIAINLLEKDRFYLLLFFYFILLFQDKVFKSNN